MTHSWKRILLTAGIALTSVVAIVLGVRWLAQQGPAEAKAEDLSLEAQWNKTIRRLGIEPVFPPEEDLAVGDLFAAVVEDDDEDPTISREKVGPSTPFLGKAVKLAHIDVRQELEDAYAALPVFPESLVASGAAHSDAGGVAIPGPVPTGLFKPGALRRSLPMAAFPGLTISHSGSAAGGVSGGLRGVFDFGSSREDSEKLVLPLVETYGLPSVSASNVLNEYCHSKNTQDVCSEEFARKHLVPLVGNRVLSQYQDENIAGAYKYGVKVRIFMVSRVYLVRAILNQQQAGGAEGGVARIAALTGSATDNGNEKTTQPVSTPTNAPADATARELALQKRLDDVEKQLAALQRGAAVAYRAQFGRQILLDQTFPRPVAIGYRHVLYDWPSADKSN